MAPCLPAGEERDELKPKVTSGTEAAKHTATERTSSTVLLPSAPGPRRAAGWTWGSLLQQDKAMARAVESLLETAQSPAVPQAFQLSLTSSCL